MMQKESTQRNSRLTQFKSISGHSSQISKLSGQFQISGQFQDTFEISGISGQLGPLLQLEDWHSEECKLMPTFMLDLLTSNKMGDQDLSCTIQLPSLVIRRVVFVYSADIQTHTHKHTYRADKCPTPATRWHE